MIYVTYTCSYPLCAKSPLQSAIANLHFPCGGLFFLCCGVTDVKMPKIRRAIGHERDASEPNNTDEGGMQKPDISYIELIAKAILAAPLKRLCLQEIYDYIERSHLYFREADPGWRNSVRHNLSLHECFCKGDRCENGKGHYWFVNPANLEDFRRGDFRRRLVKARVRRAMQDLYVRCHPYFTASSPYAPLRSYSLYRSGCESIGSSLPQALSPTVAPPLAMFFHCGHYLRPASQLAPPAGDVVSVDPVDSREHGQSTPIPISLSEKGHLALATLERNGGDCTSSQHGIVFSIENILAAK